MKNSTPATPTTGDPESPRGNDGSKNAPEEIGDDRFAKCCGRILAELRSEEQIGTPFSDYQLEWANYYLAQALGDCTTLDYHEGGDFFSERLFHSLEHQDACRAVAWRFITGTDRKAWRPVEAAAARGIEDQSAALLLWEIRELFRDGISAGEVIQRVKARMDQRTSAGNADFFRKFGDLLRDRQKMPEKFERSTEAWIRRGVLSLAFWTIDSPAEAHDICLRATKLIGVPCPDFVRFTKAWKNAKARK